MYNEVYIITAAFVHCVAYGGVHKMKSLTVRIDSKDHETLASIAKHSGKSMTATLSDIIARYRREQILRGTNEAYAVLKQDNAAWEAECTERDEWDGTIGDGLDRQ